MDVVDLLLADKQILRIGHASFDHIHQRAVGFLIIERLIERNIAVERHVLLAGSGFDGRDNLALYAQLGKEDEAREEFTQVIQFADENSTLDTQRSIAQTYINAFEGLLPPIPSANTEPANRPGDVPLVPKPVQNKGFISRQMNKKHR